MIIGVVLFAKPRVKLNPPQGWVVESLVNFNPGLRDILSSKFFFKERFVVLMKYCSEFSSK